MSKKIGLWMYRNEGGQVVHDRLRAVLERRGFAVVTDFDMRECYCFEGRVYAGDGRDLSAVDAFYHMNADEQTPYQNDVLRALERSGVPVVNAFGPFSEAKDKFTANLILRNAGVSVPPSLLIGARAPKPMIREVFARWGAVLVKPRRSHGGSGIVKFSDAETFLDFHQAVAASFGDFYIEKLIEFGGQDFRVEIFDGRAIGGYSRRATHAFKTNISSGGRMVALPPEAEQRELALKAARALGITATIVDMIRSEADGRLYVLEVNPIMGIFLEAAMRSGAKLAAVEKVDPLFATDDLKLKCIADHLEAMCSAARPGVRPTRAGS